ncbi:MAG: hypothetical protein JEZ09_14645 [Salinivirgaceae bacterium]|nr:hypothetical protein [Salinivirgaceae bacterium]
MRRGLILLIAVISILAFNSVFGNNASGKSDMQKLVNFHRMNSKHKANYIKQRTAQTESWEKNKIPKNFRIPVELQSYRGNNSARYYGLYNPDHKTGVGYVPSNLVQHYEEEAWAAYQDLGADAPSLSIILAQQFTESSFNPWASGDNNMSQGLPQLYRKTAQYLYKKDKETWKQFFYFDKYGKHHFRSVRAMIKFPFVFLPEVKQYDFEHKFEGIRRYNGAGESAVKYAEKIIKRSLFYEELFAQYNEIPLDTTGFKQNLFGIINLTLMSRGEHPIHPDFMDELLSNVIAQYQSGYVRNTYAKHCVIPVYENEPILASQKSDFIIPTDGQDYYLIIEDGRLLYTYFNDSEVVMQTISHEKNKEYYLYYNENKKKVKVNNLRKVGNRQIYSNVKPGDKVFIPPGTVLYSPDSNLAVRIN